MARPRFVRTAGGSVRRLYHRKRVALRDALEEAEPPAKLVKPNTQPNPSTNLKGEGDLLLDSDWPETGNIDMGDEIHQLEVGDDNSEVTLPLDVDLQEIMQADQYNDLAMFVQPDEALDKLPTQFFEAIDEEAAAPAVTTSTQIPGDESTALPHKRSTSRISKLVIAIGVWCLGAGISRAQYTSLLEIFRLPEMKDDLQELPSSLSTLKRLTLANLPLLTLRKQPIKLVSEQLSKDKSESKGTGENGEPVKNIEDLYFFDPINLFQSLMNSKITRKMHFGLAQYRDNPVELYHSRCWNSSIRTTSGEFAHYMTGSPIFPSDCITFRCLNSRCKACLSMSGYIHLGRVLGIGRDHRSPLNRVRNEGDIILEVQEILQPQNPRLMALPALDPPLQQNEAMLSWNSIHFILEEHVGHHFTQVVFDHSFQDDRLMARPPPHVPDGAFLIRRIHDHDSYAIESEELLFITPVCKSHPIRGELELLTYGRKYLEQFDTNLSGRKMVSVPLMTFIDGFGLYRNAYRSLMGIYFIPAALSFQERARRTNVFPLTLGPHGSNFADVIGAMKARLAALDRGLEVQINGETVRLCVSTLAYLGDMPQQQKNSSMKSQRATLGCRFCFIDNKTRGDLSYDTFLDGRYHFQTIEMRKDMEALGNKLTKEKYAREWGLDTAHPALVDISPALDILLSRPGDPAHSEYQGLSNLMHNLLLDAVLTTAAGREYATKLRNFPFPPSWPRVQGPLHHLKSYRLSEHARWSVVVPLLLRLWLRERHIQPYLLVILNKRVRDGFSSLEPVDQVVECFAAAATSNCVLMGDSISPKDRDDLDNIITTHRLRLQALLQLASDSLTANPRRRRSISVASQDSQDSQASQSVSHAAASTQGQMLPPQTLAKETANKALAYLNDIKRPNIHTALHYPVIIEEYGMASNCHTLIGEDFHRWFKEIVYSTNHHRVEKQLLSKHNMRLTLRLILANAFKNDEPELTALVHDLYARCPSMFSTILPKSEQSISEADEKNEDIDDDDTQAMPDAHHTQPTVLGCIQGKYCRDTLGLPTRNITMTAVFSRALAESYGHDYGMPHIISFSNSTFQWCKKLSFTDPTTDRRYTFKMGDFIEARGIQICIDQIFLHNWDRQRRLFVKGSPISLNPTSTDPVLGSGYHRLTLTASDGITIVGLPAIRPVQLYIVPIATDDGRIRLADKNEATEFLWAERTLQWL